MPEIENQGNIFLETLEWICSKFESFNIPYMISGGSAVGFWGHIRTTMDIDILIQIPAKQAESFLESIKNEAYVDMEEAKSAIVNKEMFNIIFNKTCFKIDIIPLNEFLPYEMKKFSRRIKINFHNKDISVISPEDLIISKLIWSKSSDSSERQLRDCESIWKLNRETLDLEYINKWVGVLKIEDEFGKLSTG